MGRAKPVVLPSRTFATQALAIAWVRDNIKDAYPLYGVITDPDHFQVLTELLERDNDAETKIGVGVREFFIGRTADGPGHVAYVRADARGVWIRRIDGSEDDWSYQSAIRQDGHQSNVKEALRAVVSPQRTRFRELAFQGNSVRCAFTGEIIARLEDAEVRYVEPSWGDLVAGFVAMQGGWDAIALTDGEGTAQIAGSLADADQRAAWVAYWKANAHPVLVRKPLAHAPDGL
jgi:hypothetical protein